MISKKNTAIDSHLKYRRLLFGALSSLARSGFTVSPHENLDLIQDFLSEDWQGICDHYDPSRGSFKVYVYGQFLRFSRPRIIRMQRWKSRLSDGLVIRQMVTKQQHKNLLCDSLHGIEMVVQIIEKLSIPERKILLCYLTSKSCSERNLTSDFEISPYHRRETLIKAFSRIAVQLGESEIIAAEDRKVIVSLWRDGRTVTNAALHLNRPVSEIQDARNRIFKLLATGISQVRLSRACKQRINIMNTDIARFLKEAFNSPGNVKLLQEVEKLSDQILDYMESVEDDVIEKQLGTDIDYNWMAEVFAAIAGKEDLEDSDCEALQHLIQANEKIEISIGEAFRQVLTADLPPELYEIDTFFSAVEPIPEDWLYELYEDPIVLAGGEYASKLASYGITPMTIYYATEAISSLANRLIADRMDRTPVVIEPEPNTYLDNDEFVLPHDLVRSEIISVSECIPEASDPLLKWLVALAQHRPYLFNRFIAEPAGKAIRLSHTNEAEADVYRLWGNVVILNDESPLPPLLT